MPSFSYTNNIQNGDPLDASKMMANFNDVRTLLVTTKLDADNIANGAITNTQVASGANIVPSKLAVADGRIIIGDASNVGQPIAVTGDVTVSNTGVTALGSGVIVNADVNASAAIDYSKLNLATSILNADINASAAIAVSKLAAGTSAQVLLNSSGPVPTWTSLSGDVTVGATGTTAIGAGKVTNAMLLNGLVKNRQGGTTGDNSWGTSGTSNTDVSAKGVFIQTGYISSSAGGDVTVTFPTAYNQVPIIIGTTHGAPAGSNTSYQVQSVNTTTFTFNTLNSGGSRVATGTTWLAIGQ